MAAPTRLSLWAPRLAAMAAALMGFCTPPGLAQVEVHVVHAGFPSISGGDVVRSGAWTPVTVDLSLTRSPSFDGVVRLAQPDSDGDEAYDSVEVHLRTESGGNRRVILYALANPARTDQRFTVELRSSEGEAAQILSDGVLGYRAAAPTAEVLAQDDRLILYVSHAAVGRFAEFDSGELRGQFLHPTHVAHISPTDLPELWIGLEAVDYIIWDDADPAELTPRQLEALLDWTRNGGTLLIAAARTASAIKLATPLLSVLPVELSEVIAVENLPQTRRALFDVPKESADFQPELGGWYTLPFYTRVSLVKSKARPGGRVLARENEIDSDTFVQGHLERGQLIFSSVALKDLFSVPGGLKRFFYQVFGLRAAEKADQNRPGALSVFEKVVSAVAFTTSSSLYLLAAAGMSILYALAATFGVWQVLGRRGWRQHSWTAFAGLAAATSAASMLTVGWMRGFGDRLHQIAVIDADAGATYGHATAFFGLKTSLDKEVDVWLPSDWKSATEPQASSCFLRPLPQGDEMTDVEGSFADPEEYRLAPAAAVIDDVRVRGTLKRFEGRWNGPLGGKLTGLVKIVGNRITDDSFIVNDLGVTLTDCYLLHPILNTTDIAGSRDQAMYAFKLGDLPSDGVRLDLFSRCYGDGSDEAVKQALAQSKLENAHRGWSARFRGLLANVTTSRDYTIGQEKDALLLLSTLGEFDSDTLSGLVTDWGGNLGAFSRDRLRNLDLRDQLHAGRWATGERPAEEGAVILIGFSPSPGPMRLFSRSGKRDFRPLEPESAYSWSMYRIRIPTTRLPGAPEKRDAEDPYSPSRN